MCVSVYLMSTSISLHQARELQTLHNLRRLFVQDLNTRVKRVRETHPWGDVYFYIEGI